MCEYMYIWLHFFIYILYFCNIYIIFFSYEKWKTPQNC